MRLNPLRAVNVAFGIGIFLVCALLVKEYTVWKYRPLAAGKDAAGAKNALGAARQQKDFTRYQGIASSGIMGQGQLSLIEQTKGVTAAFVDITLLGTVVGKAGDSYAIFQDKHSKKQEILSQGENVFNVGELTAIEADRALVNAGGMIQTFYLPTEQPSQKGAQEGPSSAPDKHSAVTKTGTAEWVIDQRALNSVLSDIGKVLTDARLLPYSEGGKVAGFRISEIKPGGIFGLMGLQNGDILLRINDYEVDSPEKGVKLLSGLRGESSVSMDIRRDGKPKRLNYQIR